MNEEKIIMATVYVPNYFNEVNTSCRCHPVYETTQLDSAFLMLRFSLSELDKYAGQIADFLYRKLQEKRDRDYKIVVVDSNDNDELNEQYVEGDCGKTQ